MEVHNWFQGSNIRTKTGTSAADLLEEASHAPASFAAARAALGVAALKQFMATLRDAGSARHCSGSTEVVQGRDKMDNGA